jgi:hypothetical protein
MSGLIDLSVEAGGGAVVTPRFEPHTKDYEVRFKDGVDSVEVFVFVEDGASWHIDGEPGEDSFVIRRDGPSRSLTVFSLTSQSSESVYHIASHQAPTALPKKGVFAWISKLACLPKNYCNVSS